MLKFSFEEYFEESENIYYEPKLIITILERLTESNFDDIKTTVRNSKVLLTEEEIKAFLEQKLVEENLELKQRVENRRLKQEKSIMEKMDRTAKEIEESCQAFTDDHLMKRYQFEPYALKYFNTYIEIVRDKLLTLLTIIEKIVKKDVSPIQDLMTDLDIVLDKNGNVSKEDIIRLITPTIYNLAKLNKKLEEANELSTYLTCKISEASLMRMGCSENEVYPNRSLQDKGLYGYNGNENVSLSKNQEQVLRKKQKRNSKIAVKSILK